MEKNISSNFNNQSNLKSLWVIFISNWKTSLLGFLFVFFLTNILISGSIYNILSYIKSPFVYNGDALSVSWWIQRTMEGSLIDSFRSGYPFGSNLLGYPNSDSGSLLLLKLLGSLSGKYWVALNLYFILGFPLVFLSSYLVVRSFGLINIFSFSAAVIYALLPYHFERVGHLFLSFYFVVPLFFYISYWVYTTTISKKPKILYLLIWLSSLIFLASFGIYYAFFGCIVIATSGVISAITNSNYKYLIRSLIIIAGITLGILINTAPNIYDLQTNDNINFIAKRLPQESEMYGLKLIQLILPRTNHRIESFAKTTKKYNESAPLVNENETSSLGLIGSTGLFISLIIIFIVFSERREEKGNLIRKNNIFIFLTSSIFILFLSGTIGGLGSIFAYFITPEIRGWNRISVFIGFASISLFFLSLEQLILKYATNSSSKSLIVSMSLLLLAVGIFDQTSSLPFSQRFILPEKQYFDKDREFISNIESSLPRGSAIYQLPYIGTPEVPSLYKLGTYDLLVGFLNSKALKWSFGAIKGSIGDIFYKNLSKEPLDMQLSVIRKLGFSGIYVDLRGFEDGGKTISKNLKKLLGLPKFTHASKTALYFDINQSRKVDFKGLSNIKIMEAANYVVGHAGKRYTANISDGINFIKKGYPSFLVDMTGLGDAEVWGRWSIAKKVNFKFTNNLPNKFILSFRGKAFGPNTSKKLMVKIGDIQKEVVLLPGTNFYSIKFDLNNIPSKEINFNIPRPTSPYSLGINTDSRKLGFGFVSLHID